MWLFNQTHALLVVASASRDDPGTPLVQRSELMMWEMAWEAVVGMMFMKRAFFDRRLFGMVMAPVQAFAC